MNNKLGALALSGLMIGPILGSGILILPPLVVQRIGAWAIYAWMLMIGVSFLFALIIGQLTIRFPGEGGVTNAVAVAFGTEIKRLTSFLLIIGVVFGAVAVLMTAANYLAEWVALPAPWIGYILLCLCIGLLMTRISFVGNVALIMSLVAAVILFWGGAKTLTAPALRPTVTEAFDPLQFGYAVLLLFWTLFGWEVIGNYSAEVKDPRKTITRAIGISAIVIAAVELTVAAAMQRIGPTGDGATASITPVVASVFQEASHGVIALVTLFLCCSTYLLFVGSVVRLTASLATERALPAFFGRRLKNNTPLAAIIGIFLLHTAVFGCFTAGVFTIEKLIALSNGFFIANSLICICAGVRLIKNGSVKIAGTVLALFFLAMLAHYATGYSLLVIGGLAVYSVVRQWRQRRHMKTGEPV